MDLTDAAIFMKQVRAAGQVQMHVAKRMLDVQKMRGAAAVQLIQSAGKVGASAGDSLVAAATGLGGAMDTYA